MNTHQKFPAESSGAALLIHFHFHSGLFHQSTQLWYFSQGKSSRVKQQSVLISENALDISNSKCFGFITTESKNEGFFLKLPISTSINNREIHQHSGLTKSSSYIHRNRKQTRMQCSCKTCWVFFNSYRYYIVKPLGSGNKLWTKHVHWHNHLLNWYGELVSKQLLMYTSNSYGATLSFIWSHVSGLRM